MKNLLYIISMAILLAACTNDIENDAIQTDILTLTVGDFPAFGEDAATRAIGTTDAGGKSAWEAGDQLLVSVTCMDNYAHLEANLRQLHRDRMVCPRLSMEHNKRWHIGASRRRASRA